MEILKFSEPPKRSSRSGSARKSGLMPMVTFGIAVLVLGGMSTTLAGTITLNSGSTVEFGQGVVTTAACDTSISVTPTSSYDTSTSFYVSSVKLSNIGIGVGDTGTAAVAAGCLGKTFTLRAYSSTAALDFTKADGSSTAASLKVTLPSTIANAVAGTGFMVDNSILSGLYTATPGGVWTAITTTSGSGLAGEITLANFRLPATVEKITVESSS